MSGRLHGAAGKLRAALPVVPVVAAALALHWYAAGFRISLGYDEFFAVEAARDFAHGSLARFQTLWPAGYPLLGSPLAALGMAPAHALLVVNALAFLGIVAATNALLRDGGLTAPRRWLAVTAFAALPIWFPITTTALSETAFTALLLGVFRIAIRPPEIGRAAAVGLGIAALVGVRYAGAIFLALPFTLAALRGKRAGRERWLAAGVATAVAVAGVAAIGWINVRHSGFAFGADRLVPDFAVLAHAGKIGEALLGTFGRHAAGWLPPSTAIAFGLAAVALLLAPLMYIAVRTSEAHALRAAAATAILYIVGIVSMRSVVFAIVSEPRFALPVLPFALVIAAALLSRLPRVALPVCAVAVLAIGMVQAVRGYRNADPLIPVSEAERAIAAHVRDRDVVLVNHAAKSIARHLACDVRFFRSPEFLARDLDDADFIVICARELGGEQYRFEDDWRLEAGLLAADARFRAIGNSERFAVFERAAGSGIGTHALPGR